MTTYPHELKHVALYLRKSRADIEAEARGEGETLSKHRRALFEIAKKYRYAVDGVYEEVVSGERIIDRPEMQRLLHDVQTGKYSAVLCMDIDRLGRGNMIDQGLIQDTFKSSDTLIITPRKVYDLQDEMDEEWSEFEAFMARRELKTITRRMQRGRQQSAAEGKSISKKPPYGYLRDDNLRLYPDPQTASVIKMIFEMAADGSGRRIIANKLEELNVPSPSGNKRWDITTISSILSNPVYLGHIVWGRVSYKKESTGGYNRKATAEEDWIVKQNAHESLVSQEIFDRAREMAKRNQPKIPKNAQLSSPLAGLVFCSQCGRAMRRQKTYNRPYNSLHCITPACSTRGSRFEIVEDRLIQVLKKTLNGMLVQDSDKTRQKSNSTKDVLQSRRAKLIDTLSELQLQTSNMHDLLEQGVYNIDTFLKRNQMVSERLETVNDEIQRIDFELQQIQSSEQSQKLHVPKIRRVLDAYDEAQTPKQKNDFLKEIIEKVVYTRPQDWKDPDRFELEVFLKL